MEPKEHEHTTFPSGAQRSERTGKGRYDLIAPNALQRLAIQYEAGAEHHKDARNWLLGFPISRALCSAIGHVMDHLKGDRSEDHLAAGAWQLFAAMEFEELIEQGKLPVLLNDVPFDANTLPPDTGEIATLPVPEVQTWDDWFSQVHDLSAVQEVIGNWADEKHPKTGKRAICEHLRREVVELTENFAPDEAADCLILLLHLAHKANFNLLGEMLKKHKINTERLWATEPDEQGIYLHIKEEDDS